MAKTLKAKQSLNCDDVELEIEDDGDGDIRIVDDEGTIYAYNTTIAKPRCPGGPVEMVQTIRVKRQAWLDAGYEIEVC
jgi:hypothetical protein